MRRAAAGMTLIEVLVALTALSLLTAGMITAFRVGHRTFDRILKSDRAYSDVVVAQRFVRRVVESAYPFDGDGSGQHAVGLEGSSEKMELTAPASEADQSAGLRRISFELVRRPDGLQDLVVASTLDRNGAAALTDREVLIPGLQDAEWGFLDVRGGTLWQTRWAERRPPSLVRLRVTFPAGDTRRWPDLLIAPRVTDDANCNFDVVSQNCRPSQS